MPLGCFVRMLWGRGVVVSTATGLAVSAMIETTQITGVWGIYPCPYRVFDVDDLLANTSGALLGAVLVSLLLQLRSRLLPAASARISWWTCCPVCSTCSPLLSWCSAA